MTVKENDKKAAANPVNALIGIVVTTLQKGERLPASLEMNAFSNPSLKTPLLLVLRTIFAQGDLKPNAYVEKLLHKDDSVWLAHNAKSPEKMSSIIPRVISTEAILDFLRATDTSATPDIHKSGTSGVNRDSNVFKAVIEAAIQPGQIRRNICAKYLLDYLFRRLEEAKKTSFKGNGFFPTNSVLIDKITEEDRKYITKALDPFNASEKDYPLARRIFDKFLDMMKSDWSEDIVDALTDLICERTRGKRFLESRDEATVKKFDVTTGHYVNDKLYDIQASNELRESLRETLGYKPLYSDEPYAEIFVNGCPNSTVIVPQSEIVIRIGNLEGMKNNDAKTTTINDYEFHLDFDRVNWKDSKIERLPLLQENLGRKEVKVVKLPDPSDLSMMVDHKKMEFSGTITTTIKEASRGELTIKSFLKTDRDIKCRDIEMNFIVLPAGVDRLGTGDIDVLPLLGLLDRSGILQENDKKILAESGIEIPPEERKDDNDLNTVLYEVSLLSLDIQED